MKKVFPLQQPGRVPARVVEAVKNEVRKYVKREHRKKPAEGFDTWNFACRTGVTRDTASECALPEITSRIDAAAAEGATEIYIEILAVPARRSQSPNPEAGPDAMP